jgi:3-dehydroquinate dehydratase
VSKVAVMEDKYENVLTLITYYQMVREERQEGGVTLTSLTHNYKMQNVGHIPKHSFQSGVRYASLNSS